MVLINPWLCAVVDVYVACTEHHPVLSRITRFSVMKADPAKQISHAKLHFFKVIFRRMIYALDR